MAQIIRDIEIPPNVNRKNYVNFIKNRLVEEKNKFYKKFNKGHYEEEFSGLYSILRLS